MKTEDHPSEQPTISPAPGDETASRKPAAEKQDSRWVTYLTGKKVKADRFIAGLKGRIPVPDPEAVSQFAAALAAKPARTDRVIALLQETGSRTDGLREVSLTLAAAGLEALGVGSIPGPGERHRFEAVVRAWLDSIGKRPLSKQDLSSLLLLFLVGSQRDMMDEDLGFGLLADAISKRPKKGRANRSKEALPATSDLDVALAAGPSPTALAPVVAMRREWASGTHRLHAQLRERDEEIQRGIAERERLQGALTAVRAEAAELRSGLAFAEQRIAELEAELIEVHDGYQYMLHEVQGRIRGVLGGQITRWVRTALDASRANPPRIQAIDERLEDALTLIEKELECLQPSA
jgi:hypothetical protein